MRVNIIGALNCLTVRALNCFRIGTLGKASELMCWRWNDVTWSVPEGWAT